MKPKNKKYYAYVYSDGVEINTSKSTKGASIGIICQLIAGLESLKVNMLDEFDDARNTKLEIIEE